MVRDSIDIRRQIAMVEYWLDRIKPDRHNRRISDKYAAANIKVAALENKEDGESSFQ